MKTIWYNKGYSETRTRRLIRQRWLQVQVHSELYYRYDTSIVDDKTWDRWARELVSLVKDNPKIANSIGGNKLLQFDGSSGFDLIGDRDIEQKALKLLRYYKTLKGESQNEQKKPRRARKRRMCKI